MIILSVYIYNEMDTANSDNSENFVLKSLQSHLNYTNIEKYKHLVY